MASLISHAVVAAALGQAAPARDRGDRRFWTAAVLCSCLPDADVLGFLFGVRYGDLWGHRGMTHSLLFAAVVGIAAAAALPDSRRRDGWKLAALLTLITASHGFLDAFTDGGLGVAFFSPFDRTRYFFPWRPVRVSPIGILPFFSRTGLNVLLNEAGWIWLPSLALGALLRAVFARSNAAEKISSDRRPG
ncbi:MAG: metal-dependent hydrolase [Elusimicrobia bacterium]|nr:metal-dependent hydrolase [Elusimicrobiota bacterium]